MTLQGGGLGGGVARLERGGSRLEERVVVAGIGGGHHEEVVFELHCRPNVTLVSRRNFRVHGRREAVRGRRFGAQKRNHRCGETDSGDDNGTADAA